jgi:mannose-1-phosphate guanylyltransferase
MTEHYYALILAGGGGTRLWPLSRKDTPKQLLKLINDRTMFQISVERLAPLFPPERIFIVTGEQYIQTMREQAPQIPEQNFIIEPFGCDSGPAAALGAAIIHQIDPDAIIAQLAVDHYIGKPAVFLELLKAAYTTACKGYIVTLGIAPSFPATGFGYIRQGDEIEQVNGFTSFHTRGFTEKPNEITATSFVASGQYSWNSGMFIWKSTRAMEEFEHQRPEIFEILQQIQALFRKPSLDKSALQQELSVLWKQMPKISIDYAVMESAKQMAVIPAEISWNDVGSWASLFDVHRLDRFGNVFLGDHPDHVVLDTEKTLVLSDRLVVTIGIDDLIVIDTDDVLLICHKDRSQDVREVVNHLKANKQDRYL